MTAVEQVACAHCGTSISSARSNQKFCSPRCRSTAWGRTPQRRAKSREYLLRWRRVHTDAERERSRRRYRDNIDSERARSRDRAFIRRFGLTPADRTAMLVRQGGVCALCAKPMAKPEVDHDHVTGRVRGLLCRPCNMNLGGFEALESRRALVLQYLELGR